MRNGLLEDTAAAIAERGVDGFNLRQLARGRGLSTTAIYTLFGSKDELIAETAARAFNSFSESQEAVPRHDDALTHLTQLGRAYRLWALSNPALFRLIFEDRLDREAGREAFRNVFHRRATQPIQAAVSRAIEAGFLRNDLTTIVLAFWATVHGAVGLELGPLKDMPRDERDATYETILRTMISGWGTDSAPQLNSNP